MLTPSVNVVQSSFGEEQQGEISGSVPQRLQPRVLARHRDRRHHPRRRAHLACLRARDGRAGRVRRRGAGGRRVPPPLNRAGARRGCMSALIMPARPRRGAGGARPAPPGWARTDARGPSRTARRTRPEDVAQRSRLSGPRRPRPAAATPVVGAAHRRSWFPPPGSRAGRGAMGSDRCSGISMSSGASRVSIAASRRDRALPTDGCVHIAAVSDGRTGRRSPAGCDP